MPDIVIVAGPNGAGKTTFANQYLPAERGRFVYVNADEIAREPELSALTGAVRSIAAGRIMLGRIDRAVENSLDVMFETTLASLSYARKIAIWRRNGYHVTLIYLRLETVELSLERAWTNGMCGTV